MAEGNTLATRSLKKRQKRSRLRWILLVLALWIPYWLWVENDLAQKAKPTLRGYFEEECARTADRKKPENTARCLATELDYVSANTGLVWTHATFSVTPVGQPPRRRYFRFVLSWTTFQWSVEKEISSARYVLAL